MNYIGKSVEFQAHGGTYQGIVVSLENNKITLESGTLDLLHHLTQ